MQSTVEELERATNELGEKARALATVESREKPAILREIMGRVFGLAPRLVAAACEAKGIVPGSELAGEAWLSGPVASILELRVLAELFDAIGGGGGPTYPLHVANDRVVAAIPPRGAVERVRSRRFSVDVVFDASVRTKGEVAEKQGAHLRSGASIERRPALVAEASPPSSSGAIIVTPYLYARDEIAFQARAIGAAVLRAAAFGGEAPAELVLASGWAQADSFLTAVGNASKDKALSASFVGAEDVSTFLPAAVKHANDRGGATSVLVAPEALVDEHSPHALEIKDAIAKLAAKVVGLNHWPPLLEASLGPLHEARTLTAVDKIIVAGPVRMWPKPLWFRDNRRMLSLAQRLAAYHVAPSWPGLAALFAASARG